MSVTPGIVVAAPSSGSGKTTVATGLMAALHARGVRVAPFKVGPDYIDPGYHGLACGRPGRNLDPVLVGEHRIGPLYTHGVRGCEVAVVEGVMGLFDGRESGDDPSGVAVARGSTAHVAALLGLPVLLVVDARGQAQSLAALVRGFATHDPGTRIAGVVLNRVGSDRHRRILTAASESAGVPVLGSLPRDAAVEVPSRHLGLVTADESQEALGVVSAMGDLVARHVDLDAVHAAARPGPDVEPWVPSVEIRSAREAEGGAVPDTGGEPVGIALLSGPAFSFAYAEFAELAEAAGARVVRVDPLRDPLPPGVDALVIPGGFPEVHATSLAANRPLMEEIARCCTGGMPVYAECAGLLYLSREIDGVPMVGALPVAGRFGPRLHLGYRDAVAAVDSVVLRAGERFTGHEFHRTRVDAVDASGEAPPPAFSWRLPTGERADDGVVTGGVHASYLHLHPAGYPRLVTRLVDAARAHRACLGNGPGGSLGSPA